MSGTATTTTRTTPSPFNRTEASLLWLCAGHWNDFAVSPEETWAYPARVLCFSPCEAR